MSVDTYWDQSFYPGMGGGGEPGDPPTITSPADGATVEPIHQVTGTAEPGRLVTLWSAHEDDPLAVHSTTTADANGLYVFDGTKITGRDGDTARFEARTLDGTSALITVTVAGPVLTDVDPDTVEQDVAESFVLTGQRLDSMDGLQVLVVDPGGAVRRIVPDPGDVTATAVAFDTTFTATGTASVSLAEGATGPEMTAQVPITVTAPVEADEPEPETEPEP